MRREPTQITKSLALALCLMVAPSVAGAAAAQEESDEIVALEQRIAALESALDSLQSEYGARLAALEEKLETSAPLDETAPAEQETQSALNADEKAALEAELAGILGEGEGQRAGSAQAAGQEELAPTPERTFTGKSRNLNKLNPEISVTGDTFLQLSDDSGNPERNQFRLAEFEMAFQAVLDPFSLAKAFVVQEEGEFEVEEAYIDWTSLPGGLGLKFGAFRNDFGKLNRWHQHALPQSHRPLVHEAFFGEDGLRGTGVGLSWLPQPFLGDYNEFWLQVTNDENDVSFSGRGFDEPVVTLHETNYWDLSNATYMEVGVSASTGVNDQLGDFRTWVVGTDWNMVWNPPGEALYKGFELRGEFLWERREEPERRQDSFGTYAYGTYKLNRRFFVGLRGDWTELPEEPGSSIWGVSPYVDWWQSEWVRLRVQYSRNSRMFEEPEAENLLFFQVTWALGPHKHERY